MLAASSCTWLVLVLLKLALLVRENDDRMDMDDLEGSNSCIS